MEREKALNDIKLIRQMMEHSSHRIFYSPWQWIEWGIVSILGSLGTIWLMNNDLTHYILGLWVVVFVIGGVLETIFWFKESEKHEVDPFSFVAFKMWLILGFVMIVPVVFTFVFINLNLPLYIAGLWLICFASCLFMISLLDFRWPMLVTGVVNLIAGILAVTVFVDWAVYIFMDCFGIGNVILGAALLLTKGVKK